MKAVGAQVIEVHAIKIPGFSSRRGSKERQSLTHLTKRFHALESLHVDGHPVGDRGEASEFDFRQSDLRFLDRDEMLKGETFVSEAQRMRYFISHVALRKMLARRMGISPAAVKFRHPRCGRCLGKHGQISLDSSHATALNFSISRSANVILIGISNARIGVDVQQQRSWAAVGTMAERLHPAEKAELLAEPEEGRQVRFASIWARKEAYLKYRGVGLTRAPSVDYVGHQSLHLLPERTILRQHLHLEWLRGRPGRWSAIEHRR